MKAAANHPSALGFWITMAVVVVLVVAVVWFRLPAVAHFLGPGWDRRLGNR
ncbi:hypothetical protein ACHMXB_22310 (plasmid) [Arthrobacter sp. UC242_113]|uniref:hypothetical protein n=1 Tax=Arthrobacter sp. UC242_113 TaxID=3374550 RepID=UPI003757264F